MATTFSRSMRSLETDRGRGVLWMLLVGATLAAAWTAWLFLARVGLYESSDTARLEVEQASHAVQVPCAGTVTRDHLIIGQQIAAGDVLLELDATSFALELEETKAQAAGLAAQLEGLSAEIAAREEALRESQAAAVPALQEAHALYEEAQAAQRYADERARHVTELIAQGNASENEYRLAAAEAAQRAAATEAALAAEGRLEKDLRTREVERRAEIDSLAREQQRIRGALAAETAGVERLTYEIGLRRVRAPVAGTLAEAATLHPGSYVAAGERIAAVVPAGATRVVAQFAPGRAAGRVAPGQTARVRLEGFPWSRHGSLAAHVTHVAREVRNGRLQVELALADQSTSIPLQHGLPGVVEVEVERLSPAALVLRSVGTRLASRPAGASPDIEPGGRP